MLKYLKSSLNVFQTGNGFCMLAMMLAFSAIMIEPSSAQMLTGLTTMLTSITTEITGPFGKLVGVCVVIGIGFMFLTGRMDWVTALMMIAGVAIIIGAVAIGAILTP